MPKRQAEEASASSSSSHRPSKRPRLEGDAPYSAASSAEITTQHQPPSSFSSPSSSSNKRKRPDQRNDDDGLGASAPVAKRVRFAASTLDHDRESRHSSRRRRPTTPRRQPRSVTGRDARPADFAGLVLPMPDTNETSGGLGPWPWGGTNFQSDDTRTLIDPPRPALPQPALYVDRVEQKQRKEREKYAQLRKARLQNQRHNRLPSPEAEPQEMSLREQELLDLLYYGDLFAMEHHATIGAFGLHNDDGTQIEEVFGPDYARVWRERRQRNKRPPPPKMHQPLDRLRFDLKLHTALFWKGEEAATVRQRLRDDISCHPDATKDDMELVARSAAARVKRLATKPIPKHGGVRTCAYMIPVPPALHIPGTPRFYVSSPSLAAELGIPPAPPELLAPAPLTAPAPETPPPAATGLVLQKPTTRRRRRRSVSSGKDQRPKSATIPNESLPSPINETEHEHVPSRRITRRHSTAETVFLELDNRGKAQRAKRLPAP